MSNNKECLYYPVFVTKHEGLGDLGLIKIKYKVEQLDTHDSYHLHVCVEQSKTELGNKQPTSAP